MRTVLTGSAAQPWPVPGCSCVACRSGAAAPAGLQIGDLTLAAGRLGTPEGERHLRAGERHAAGDVRIVGLPGPTPARPAVVVGGARVTLLWCEGAGALPPAALEGLAGSALDAAALDLRGPGGRPDPTHLAHTLARLRGAGALAPGADVVALGRTHDLHPALVERRLAAWGVRVAPDGSALPAGHPAPALPRRTLLLGPAGSGKSAHAEDLLAADPDVVYAATGPAPSPGDPAWALRVATHRGRRPRWWRTDETGALAALLGEPGPPLLVDALGTWVAAVMDRARAWDDAPGWREQVEGEVGAVVAAWRQTRRRVVAVGEEVGWGVVPADAGTAAFREVLAGLTRRLADQSERVELVVAGRVLELA